MGLREKVNVIVSDNGANMKKGIKEMNEFAPNIRWQPCSAHTLQLVIVLHLDIAQLNL